MVVLVVREVLVVLVVWVLRVGWVELAKGPPPAPYQQYHLTSLAAGKSRVCRGSQEVLRY